MYIKRLSIYTAVFTLLSFLIPSVAFANNPKVNIEPNSFNLVEGSVVTSQLSLSQPIICQDPDITCQVEVDFTSSDPSRVTVSPSSVVIPSNEWSQIQTLTINTVISDTFNNGETVNITASPVVSGAAYYSGVVPESISISLPQADAPGLTNKTVDVVSNGSGVAVNVIDGDSNNADASTLSIISGPSHGVAEDPSGSITYTADSGYAGSDQLTYQICSSIEPSVCSRATINYNVISEAKTVTSANITPDTGYGTDVNSYLNDALLTVFTAIGILSLIIGLKRLNKNSTR